MECWSGLSSNRCWKQFRKVILSNFKVFFIHFFQQDVIALIFIPVTGINLFCLYILKDRNSLSVLWKKFFSYFLILPFSPIHPQIRSSHQIVGFRGRSFYISSSLKKKKYSVISNFTSMSSDYIFSWQKTTSIHPLIF